MTTQCPHSGRRSVASDLRTWFGYSGINTRSNLRPHFGDSGIQHAHNHHPQTGVWYPPAPARKFPQCPTRTTAHTVNLTLRHSNHNSTGDYYAVKTCLNLRTNPPTLKPSLKTHSGTRSRHSCGFFVPVKKDSQSFFIVTKSQGQNSFWRWSMAHGRRWINARCYGRVNRAEYNTRKGNRPGRLCAESDTRLPATSKAGRSTLKHIGVTI